MQRLQRQRSAEVPPPEELPPIESRERAATVATGAASDEYYLQPSPSAPSSMSPRRMPPPLPPKPRSSDALASSGSGSHAPAPHALTRRLTTDGPATGITWRRSRTLRHMSEHEDGDDDGDNEDDHYNEAEPPPLPDMPLPARLMGQEDIKGKLYSSHGISRRMTSGDTLRAGGGSGGSGTVTSTTATLRGGGGIPTITTELADDRISSSRAMVQDEESAPAEAFSVSVAQAPTTTSNKEKDKEGLLNYLSTWLLYRPSATVLAAKNILTASEVPPANPATSGKGRVYGVSLEEVMERQRESHPTLQVPLVVARALEVLHKQNGAMSEGIFREAGSTMQMNQLRARFEKGEPIDFGGEKNINNVANLLKAFLRELPEPLLTAQLYDQWVAVCQQGDDPDNADAVLWGIKDTLQLLPPVNRATLRRLVEFWALVLQYEHINRMNIAALATVVGPTMLFKAGEPMANIDIIHLVNRLTSLLILHHAWLFDAESAESDEHHTEGYGEASESGHQTTTTAAEEEEAEEEEEYEEEEASLYPFDEEDNYTNTRFNAEGVLIGGTLIKLVERLTGDQGHDPFFVQSFLLTLHSFSSPDELIDLLVRRYAIPVRLRQGRSREDWELYRLTVRSKIWFVVKTWVESYWYDFEGLDARQMRLTQFLTDKLATDPHFTKPAHKLLYMISRKATGQELSMVPVGDVPKPIKPPVLLKDFTDLHPAELARQMALAEFGFYRKIQPTECLDLRWSKQQESAPNVLELIRRFNLMSASVAMRILREKELAQRVRVMNFFINVAVECQKVQNFNGMMEIVSALYSSPIHRLKRTFEGLPQRARAVYEDFAAFTNANYRAYRETVKCAEPPCLPYLGIYLSDLTFIEEGNANVFAVEGYEGHDAPAIINFEKRRRVAVAIVDLINFQRKPFAFEPLPKVRDFLETTLTAAERELGPGGGSTRSREADDRLYQLSLECEPRSLVASVRGPPSTSSGGTATLFSSSSFSSTIRGFFGGDSSSSSS